MPSTPTNAELAAALEEYAALLEVPGASGYGARALCARIAGQLGGGAAGDPRRWKDTPVRLAVVVPTNVPEDVRARFAALPEVVALIEPGVGVTADGSPVELVTVPPAELGTALVRATGSADYVAGLEPLPAAPAEESLYRLIGRRDL